MSLEELANNGYLTRHSTSRNEIEGLWELVRRDLHDAGIEGLSDDRRFATAYNAALQLSKIVLAVSGYRVAKGNSAHYNSFESVKAAIPDVKVHDLCDYFDTCRRKRNHIEYDGSDIVTRTETEEILKKTVEYRQIVLSRIVTLFPDLA